MKKEKYYQGDSVTLKVVYFKDAAGEYMSRKFNATVEFDSNGGMLYNFQAPQFGRKSIAHRSLYDVVVLQDIDDYTHMFVPEDADVETIRQAFLDKAKKEQDKLQYWLAYWEKAGAGTKYIGKRTLEC